MGIEEYIKGLEGGEVKVEIDLGEAMVIDWVLTMHSYSQDTLDWLMKVDVQRWREEAGRVIIKGEGEITISRDDLKVLLVIVPITHRWKDIDSGYSLKVKLYKALLGEKDVRSKDRAESKDDAEDSSRA